MKDTKPMNNDIDLDTAIRLSDILVDYLEENYKENTNLGNALHLLRAKLLRNFVSKLKE